jgi:hypothetical protein
MHYTPTYSSWLNQVENWFARIQRDVITRDVFTSTKDLDKKRMRYIRQYNKQAAPLKWKYADPKAPHPVQFIRFNGLVRPKWRTSDLFRPAQPAISGRATAMKLHAFATRSKTSSPSSPSDST